MTENRSPQELIDQIRALPAALEAALRDLDDSKLDTPYGEGKWTVRQLVHHLADAHANALARMKWILTENGTTLKVYDQESWAELADMQLPMEPSLSILRGVHERCCCLLAATSDDGWQRRAKHPEIGEITLHDLVAIYADHGRTHLGQIVGLRQAKGW